MADFEFFVDIEDSSGNKLGSGPLQSVERWRYTARFDRAGSIDFAFSASDPQASVVTNRRIARAYARLNDTWTEVGAGIVDALEAVPDASGRVSLNAKGMDLIRELSYRGVGSLEIGLGSGETHANALDDIEVYAPPGWTFTPAVSPDNDYIYARYGGESVLGALVYLAERTQTHFYRSVDRTLVFTSDFTSSGIRAIQADGDLEPETCAITSIRQTIDTYDLLTRITPYGSGQGEARLTLAATSRSAPVGYTFSAANNYIQHTAAYTTYGLIDYPAVEFKEITPISGTDADLEAAADMLFDAALEELRRRATLATQKTYRLTVEGCSALLRPMQTIRVAYFDYDQGIDIDQDLYILEATWEANASGIRTTGLVVSTDDLWPKSDVSAAADAAVEGKVFQAHPQLNANSYVIAYNKNVDADEMATFRFRFGLEIVNLQQALFEFQLLPFESTVKSISSPTATSTSGGSSTPTTSSGGSQTPTSTSGGSSTPTTSSGGSSTPTSTSGGSSTPTSSGGSAHSHTVTIAGHTHTIPGHQHDITIIGNGVGALTYDIGYGAGGTAGGIRHNINSTDHVMKTDSGTGGTTSASGGSSTPTSSNESSHSHTVTISGHTHDVTVPAHTHSVTIAGHTHNVTIAAHTHTVTIAGHTHSVDVDIDTLYGIFREDDARTYGIDALEYRVNGGSWADLDTADDVSDGWYALDITSQVQNTTTFRPLQANNTLDIRPKTGVLTLTFWGGSGGNVLNMTTSVAHGISAPMLPLDIEISGAAVGTLGSNINGIWTLTSASGSSLIATGGTVANGDGHTSPIGFVTPLLTATIDAQLSIRNTIQAVAYV